LNLTPNIKNEKIISLAPGRICLFGDHQDYLALPIIACAINRHIKLTAVENGLNVFNINMPDIHEQRIIDIEKEIHVLEKGDHLLSVLKVLRRYGCIPNKGYDIAINGNIPINAGLSSSSAIVVSWVNFLITAFGAVVPITSETIARIAFEAEVLEHGAPGGRMDQFSIGLGNILYLETGEDFSYQVFHTPLKGLIIGESGVPKETIGLLKVLKENASLAIDNVKEHLQDFDIKTAKPEDLNQYLKHIPNDLHRYIIAAVTNHEITKSALLEFKIPNPSMERIGELMSEHHNVLKNLLNITVPRIDAMIDASVKAGASGAKIVGSGGGGSIVAIAPPGKEQEIIKAILSAGAVNAYEVKVDAGVRLVEN